MLKLHNVSKSVDYPPRLYTNMIL